MPANAKTVISIRTVQKTLRDVAHRTGNSTAARNDEARMICAAVPPGDDPKSIVVAFSGHIGEVTDGDPARDPYPHYLKQYQTRLPWRGLGKPARRSYSDCAEAHVWLKLCARGKDPKHYYLVSCSNFGEVASPCENCARWVDKAFSYVHRETPGYEGHIKQTPSYRQHA